jgi:uroporphyrinogen decarboxylase
MNRRERVAAVLSGRKADRPPYSFWHHFSPGELRGEPAVDAHLRHLERWGMDFLKVMNDTGFPRPAPDWAAAKASDLSYLSGLSGQEAEFRDELEILAGLRRRLGADVPMIVTVFSPWATLRRLCAPESDVHGPPKIVAADARDAAITSMLREDRAAVAAGLLELGRVLAKFSEDAIVAGADGVFLSVRDDWADTPENGTGTYDALARGADLTILEAVSSARFNMLHICGKAIDFARFSSYPVHVLNWADRYAGPSIAQTARLVDKPLSGGVDNLNTLPKGTPAQVEEEVRDAIAQAGERAFMVTPGCTYDPHAVPEANLEALVRAATCPG